jgi:hypothetical protein
VIIENYLYILALLVAFFKNQMSVLEGISLPGTAFIDGELLLARNSIDLGVNLFIKLIIISA